MSVAKFKYVLLVLFMVLQTVICADTPSFKVLYSNDTTNICSCKSPYQSGTDAFSTSLLQASVDETDNTDIEVHMLQPGCGWVPWWASTILPAIDHYDWFDTTYSVDPNTNSFASYMINGGDIVQAFISRCRTKGLSPFISYRLNDGHMLEQATWDTDDVTDGASNNLTEFYVDNPGYRIGSDPNDWNERVHDWSITAVRNYKLAFIEELCENYDFDGLELDFMRHSSLFPQSTTTSSQRASIITSVIETVRGYLDDNTGPNDYKYLCVRIPGYTEAYDALGIDLEDMVDAGVDMVNLSSHLFADQQCEVQEVVDAIPDTPVYLEMTGMPIKGDSVPGAYDSYSFRRTTLEQFYTTANLAYAQGAAGVSMFNFQYYRDHGTSLAGPFCEPPFEVFEHLDDQDWLSQQDHYYFVAYLPNTPAISTRPLYRYFSQGQSSTFTLRMVEENYVESKLRIRAEGSLGTTIWSAKFNDKSLVATDDVSEYYNNPYPNYLGSREDYRAWIINPGDIVSGDNDIEIKFESGTGTPKIIWIDVMAAQSFDPYSSTLLDMQAGHPGSDPNNYWQPWKGSGAGELIGKSTIDAEDADIPAGTHNCFYEFHNRPASDPDQVLDVEVYENMQTINDLDCTIETWIRIPAEIPNSTHKGIVIGNTSSTDTGWRLGIRCNTSTNKYAVEFQQRDNETTFTSPTGALHCLTNYIFDYSSTKWVHVVFLKHAIEYNDVTEEIEMDFAVYVDANSITSGTRTISADSLGDFHFELANPCIGSYRSDMYFVGDIGAVRIYDYLLDYSEIQDLYDDGFAVAEKTTYPNPVNSEIDVSVAAELSWADGFEADSYNVYFGTSSPGTYQSNVTDTTFDPGALDTDTTYYWRVDAVGSSTVTGDVWSFTTEATLESVKVLDMNAAFAGFDPDNYWQPLLDTGSGDLLGTPSIDSESVSTSTANWFYEFHDRPSSEEDQVINIKSYKKTNFVDDEDCTIEAWIRLPAQIPNSAHKGIIIGNADYTDTGWRFDLRCDTVSGKYGVEFQQRDNETTVTALTGAFHYLSGYVMDYDADDWVHAVFVKHAAEYNSGTGEIEMGHSLYINGSSITSGTDTISAGSLDDFYFIPRDPQLGSSRNDMYFVGDIAVVRIYNAILSGDTIGELYNNGFTELKEPKLYMDAACAGSGTSTYWAPFIGSGDGELLGTPSIDTEYTSTTTTWFYEFHDRPSSEEDQVINIEDYSNVSFIDDEDCTIEAWVRLSVEIPNSTAKGIIIGNTDYTDTGWRFDLRCDSISGKYGVEFQQRDNETAVTALTGAFHYLSGYVMDYDADDWVHAVFVKHAAEYNSGTSEIEIDHELYINGDQITYGIDTVSATSLNDFYFIPRDPQLGSFRNDMYFVGDISVIRVYDFVLDEDEVQALYNAGIEIID